MASLPGLQRHLDVGHLWGRYYQGCLELGAQGLAPQPLAPQPPEHSPIPSHRPRTGFLGAAWGYDFSPWGQESFHFIISLEGEHRHPHTPAPSALWVLPPLALSLGASLWLHLLLTFPQGGKTVKSATCRQMGRNPTSPESFCILDPQQA